LEIREVVERGLSDYPSDRDLHRLERQLEAAEKSGKPIKPISQRINDRLAILQAGGRPPDHQRSEIQV